jgi:ribosome-binding protein aMBF1 (putative translation factor)
MIATCSICSKENVSCKRYAVRSPENIFDIFVCDDCEDKIARNNKICVLCKKYADGSVKMTRVGAKFFLICRSCFEILRKRNRGDVNENTLGPNNP